MTKYKKLSEIKPGDRIIGKNGKPVTVTDAYDPHIPEKTYEITLDNGSIIKASGNHLWYIETEIDKELHYLRVKEAKKTLKNLPKESIQLLLNVANSEDEVETSLIDMVYLVGGEKDNKIQNLTVRIAESLGHIAETNLSYSDLDTYEEIEIQKGFRTYDARQFCQQMLSLTGKRQYRKKWKVIIGKVVNTEQLLLLGENINIPTLVQK